MPDIYGRQEVLLESPAANAFVITADDLTTFDQPTRSVYVGVGGDLNVRFSGNGAVILLKNVQAGSVLPIRIDRVLSTGTTALSVVGLY